MAARGIPTRRLLLAAGVSLILSPAALAQTAAEPVRIPDPPAGRALIVFYRTWEWPAAAVSYTVREGTAGLGSLSAGSYFTTVVDPGVHTYSVRGERRDGMQIEVESDETYYVRFELETGWVLYQPRLTPAEQRQFDQTSARLKLSKLLQP